MPLKTAIYIRRAEREDLDTILSWMDDEDFIRFLYGDPARSPKQLRSKIVTLLGRSSGLMMPGSIYLVIDSPEGPVGLLALQKISWRNRSCTIDLYMGQKSLRNGIVAAMAVYRALEYCFDELNLHRVGAYIYAFNTRSWRLMEKSGAKRELLLKDHVLRDGKLYDMYCYGLLREEFEQLRERYADFKGMSLADMIAAHKGEEEAESPS